MGEVDMKENGSRLIAASVLGRKDHQCIWTGDGASFAIREVTTPVSRAYGRKLTAGTAPDNEPSGSIATGAKNFQTVSWRWLVAIRHDPLPRDRYFGFTLDPNDNGRWLTSAEHEAEKAKRAAISLEDYKRIRRLKESRWDEIRRKQRACFTPLKPNEGAIAGLITMTSISPPT